MAFLSCTESFLYLISFLVIILILLWKFNRNSLLINWPILGMAPSLWLNLSHIHDFFTHLLHKNGSTFVFKGPLFGGLDFLLTSDPTNLAYILCKNFRNYHKGPQLREIFQELGDGIINVDGELWITEKKLIRSFLKQSKFQLGMEKFVQEKICTSLFSVLDHFSTQEDEAVDLQNVLHRFTFDLSCTLVFGFDPKSLSIDFPRVPCEATFSEIDEATFYRNMVPRFIWKFQEWLQIGEEKKLTKSWDIFDRFVYDCISRKREQVTSRNRASMEKTGGSSCTDFLTFILSGEEAEDEEKVAFRKSDKLLRDLTTSLLSAQSNTVSAELSWMLWLVATHPTVEAKILDEIKNARLQDSNYDHGVFSNFQDLNKLVYLHATINETLRMYPAAPFNVTFSIEEDILPSGHRIDKNTKIIYSIYSMGKMEEIWGEDCLEFKPERWITEDGGIKNVSACKFPAFNAGRRICLGKDMAIVQMKAVASALIWNYRFNLVQNHSVSPSLTSILHMEHGLKVRVSKR